MRPGKRERDAIKLRKAQESAAQARFARVNVHGKPRLSCDNPIPGGTNGAQTCGWSSWNARSIAAKNAKS